MKVRHRHIVLTLLAGAIMAPTFAYAASLGGTSSTTLTVGVSTVAACDEDGFDATFQLTAGNVTGVELDGIADPGCEGALLTVTLVDANDDRIGDGGPTIVAVDGDAVDNSATVAIDPQPVATSVTATHVSLVGP